MASGQMEELVREGITPAVMETLRKVDRVATGAPTSGRSPYAFPELPGGTGGPNDTPALAFAKAAWEVGARRGRESVCTSPGARGAPRPTRPAHVAPAAAIRGPARLGLGGAAAAQRPATAARGRVRAGGFGAPPAAVVGGGGRAVPGVRGRTGRGRLP